MTLFTRSVRCIWRLAQVIGVSVALLACAPDVKPLRDPTAPLGATTRFSAEQFAGRWQIVSSTSPDLAGAISVTQEQDGFHLEGALNGSFVLDDPGVLTGGDGVRWVIMWVDDGFQTAAMGTASGDRAMLVSRAPTVPQDKRVAAFEIFDFYGWDITRFSGGRS